MLKKWRFLLPLTLTLIVMLTFGTVASAFSDLPKGGDRDKINALKDRGIVSGYGNLFKGNKKMTNAEGVHLIVKGMDLSLAAFLFIKEPLASDYFTKVPNDAWYSQSFVIASVNGVELPKDIDPKAEMSRGAFAHYLLQALLIRGDYPFTKMLVHVADEADVKAEYRHSLQLLLNAKIVELDKDGKFYPKQTITRKDAAVLLYNTLEFMKKHEQPVPQDGYGVDETVTHTVAKLNDEVNKVTLSWGEKPNAGYAISIEKVVFTGADSAEIHYKLHYPERDQMYAEVITTPTASTYLAANVKPVLVQVK